jgi:periplasmic protein TonB
MFEDSTFESTGRIHTRSRGWMVAALALNSSILLAMVVIPLIYLEALPRQPLAILLTAPPPTSNPPTATHQLAHQSSGPAVEVPNPITIPTHISRQELVATGSAPVGPVNIGPSGSGSDVPGGAVDDAFRPQPAPTVIHTEPKTPTYVPSSVAAGLLIYKAVPPYPALARAMHIQGTVELAATISKAGTIANLRVVSGPAVLQQAARDAVSTWRYRPYLLNGQPVDVETTINVIFTLGG